MAGEGDRPLRGLETHDGPEAIVSLKPDHFCAAQLWNQIRELKLDGLTR
jgi:hypothetical protein